MKKQIVSLFLENKCAFEESVGITCPMSWPVEKDILPDLALLLKADQSLIGWLLWFIIHKVDRCFIGDVGFKGKPDKDGMIEIGYSIIPEYRKMGLGFESVQTLIRFGFSVPEVKIITANTDSQNLFSIKILRKMNMYCYDSEIEEGKEILKWKLTKEDFLENE